MFNGQISEVTYGNVFLTVSPVAASCEGNGEQEDAQEGRGQHSQWQTLWPRDKCAADSWQDYRAVLLCSLSHPSALWILHSTFLLLSEIRLSTITVRKTSNFSANPEINLKSCSGLSSTHSRKQGINNLFFFFLLPTILSEESWSWVSETKVEPPALNMWTGGEREGNSSSQAPRIKMSKLFLLGPVKH